MTARDRRNPVKGRAAASVASEPLPRKPALKDEPLARQTPPPASAPSTLPAESARVPRQQGCEPSLNDAGSALHPTRVWPD